MLDSATAPVSAPSRSPDRAAGEPLIRQTPACKPSRLQAIFTADDFGASSEINRAIDRAHRRGVLAAASLMVTGDAFDAAVEQAKQSPSLAVGLHLALTDAAPVLPPSEIPHLIDANGQLPRDPAKMGFRLAASRAARSEMAREMRAQFEKFTDSGLPLSHVDGHMHLHIHPAIFSTVAALASEFKAAGVRLPREPVLPAVRSLPTIGVSGAARTACLSILSRRKMSVLDKSGLKYSCLCYGVSRTGRMDAAYVVAALRSLAAKHPDGQVSAEFVFHPTDGSRRETLGANPDDLAALLEPEVRNACDELNVELVNYYTLLGNRHST